MAEKDKGNQSLDGSASNLHRYPSKDQIVARLVQIRECTAKAEETLHSMPPHAQNDPKFYQLQEMLSEMREAEKRLLDILGDYDAGSPLRSRFNPENLQMLQGNTSTNALSADIEDITLQDAQTLRSVAPELLNEREALKQKCLESQQRIETLEKQRKLLMEACSRSTERGKSMPASHYTESGDANNGTLDNRMQAFREVGDTIYSQRCGSAGGIIAAEDLDSADSRLPNLSELADKRLEVHSIISEIALLRRAKDESTRKIELLQQSLKRNDEGETESIRVDSPAGSAPVKSDSVEYLDELSLERGDNSSDNGNNIASSEWMPESFTENISRKLLEIQAMRQKLETLQNLVHTIPTPGSFNGVENEVEILSMKSNDAMKDASRLSGSMFSLPDRNLDFNSRIKSGSSTSARSSFAGDMDVGKHRNRIGKKPVVPPGMDHNDEFDRNAQRAMGLPNGSRMESPPPRQVRPVPIRAQPSSTFGDSLVFPGLPRSDREENFMHKNLGGNDRHGSGYLGQNNHEYLPTDERPMGNSSFYEPGRQWGAFSSPSAVPSYGMNHSSSSATTAQYVVESNSLLKHLVRSMEMISSVLENQSKQIETLKDSMDRLTNRFGVLLYNDMDYQRMLSSERRRNNIMSDSLPDMLSSNEHANGMEPRTPMDHSTLYQGSRHQNYQDYGYSQVKGVNPAREVWGANNYNASSSCSTSYPPEQLNVGLTDDHHVGVGTSSAFYNPNPSSYTSKVKRPWVSPGTLEPSRLMLNNQVPPGNRTNNYWDNFRSQSRQNVLSTSAKSNESYNAVVAINPEATHAQAAGGSSTNNFNRLEVRHDKHPGPKPMKAAMMKHFVENIGSKKRNQEPQRQQLPPQRSVSVGSMPHTLDHSNPLGTSRQVRHNGLNDLNASSARANKEFLNNPGEHQQFSSKLTPKEANVLRQAHQGQDCLKDMYAKVSQIKSEVIRQRTLDTLRNLVAQSILQDQLVEGHLEGASGSGMPATARSNRMNVELQSGDQASLPAHISSPGRSELSEILWGHEPYESSNSSRLLPYAGIAETVTENSQSDSSRRGLSSGIFTDPRESSSSSFLSSHPPRTDSFPTTTGRRSDRQVELSSESAGENVPSSDPWLNYVPLSYLQNNTSKKNRGGTSSSTRHELSDVCGSGAGAEGETTTGDLYSSQRLASCLQFPPEDRPSVLDRFSRDSEKSPAEGEFPKALSKPDSDGSGSRSAHVVQGSHEVKEESQVQEASSNSRKETVKKDESVSNNSLSLDEVKVTASPLRDSNNSCALEDDLDASLLNISGTAFLAEPSSPESSSPVAHSFSSNVKYKGRLMNQTNNPWVCPSLKGAEDSGQVPKESPAPQSQDEDDDHDHDEKKEKGKEAHDDDDHVPDNHRDD